MTSTRHATRTTTDSEAASAAAEAAEGIRKDASREAERLRQTATAEVEARAEEAKDGVADEVSSVGDALRRASDELRTGSPQEQVFASAASSLADFADNLRGRDTGELIGSISDFGRRNPVAFLGGAALLGFAGVRMAKASSRGPEFADASHTASRQQAAPGMTPPTDPVTASYQTSTPFKTETN